MPPVFSNIPYSTKLSGENLVRFETARKLVEKILAADYANNSSLLELTTFGG